MGWNQVKDYIPTYNSQQDSAIKVQKYIDEWVVRQKTLEKARQDSAIDFKAINRKTSKLKEDLIIHQYHSNYITSNLDTSISKQELKSYYQDHIESFILKEKIIKGFFFKMNKNSPSISKAKRLFFRNDSLSFVKLFSIVEKEATNYDLDKDRWRNLNDYLTRIPFHQSEKEINKLLTNKKIIFDKEENLYFVKLYDLISEKNIAPFETRETTIRHILINKRKQEVIRNLNKQFLKDSL